MIVIILLQRRSRRCGGELLWRKSLLCTQGKSPREKNLHVVDAFCFWRISIICLILSVGGCGGAGHLGRHRHLLPLHHRGRGLDVLDTDSPGSSN